MSGSTKLYTEALEQFGLLLESAAKTDLREPTAMILATADADGRPSARTMLLKHFDEQGFIFYTNSHSRKARDLLENPHASLCFFWQPLMQQVRIEGTVEPINTFKSDSYWETRARDSQIGAWASQQSNPLEDRKLLEHEVSEYQAKFSGQRVLYENDADGWHKSQLYP